MICETQVLKNVIVEVFHKYVEFLTSSADRDSGHIMLLMVPEIYQIHELTDYLPQINGEN